MLSNSIKQLSIERNACALAVGGEPLPNTCGMSKTTCIENLIYFKESELGDDFSRPLERHDKRVRHRGSIAWRAETGIVTGNTCHVSRREGRQVEKRTLRNCAVRERVRRLTNSGRNVRDHDGIKDSEARRGSIRNQSVRSDSNSRPTAHKESAGATHRDRTRLIVKREIVTLNLDMRPGIRIQKTLTATLMLKSALMLSPLMGKRMLRIRVGVMLVVMAHRGMMALIRGMLGVI